MTSSDQKLRVAIVGCGGFARNYLPVYRSIPKLRVVTCGDADLAAAQSMAAHLGAETASTDLIAAVQAEADYAVVSTPKPRTSTCGSTMPVSENPCRFTTATTPSGTRCSP
jgi:D-arabinose 1-dehydrogenase-like Zn-dependent alcohol dehydrogenase